MVLSTAASYSYEMHILHLLAFMLGLTQLTSTSPICSNCNPQSSDHLNYLFPRRGGGSAGARGSSGGASSSGARSSSPGTGSLSSGVGGSSSGTKGGSSLGVGNGSSGGKGSSSSGGSGSRSSQTGSGFFGSGWVVDPILEDEIADDSAAALTPVRTILVAGLVAGTVVLGGFGT